ncbi:hypothetical protein [Yinghuangia soli]|uniref:HEAT repeat domain-containing protein n=1 Tax=Yinghuangia soli TaxID=2908204 RepID=A0AA41Q074_9ACTN|nr:hypothetical protein [Yinghuangia soli]MCF2529068.1 hypothetical protein [Yinghuangia soli]
MSDAAPRLVELLLAADVADDLVLAHDAVAALARQPRAVVRLDQAVRHQAWCQDRYLPWQTVPWPDAQTPPPAGGPACWHEQIRRRIAVREPGPIAVVLAVMHPDGRLRESALRRMTQRSEGVWTPYITLRTTDWVRPVREIALLALVDRLLENPAAHLRPAAELVFSVPDRKRARTARLQVDAAIAAGPREVLGELRASPIPALRRAAFRAGTWPGTALDELVRVAEGDGDPRLRPAAAETAAREALWTGRGDLLARLAMASHASVRAVGIVAAARAGDPGRALGALDDVSAVIRASARDIARRHGVDALAHYRAAVSGPEAPAPGALSGLGETGGPTDAALAGRWLAHPEPDGRLRALQALGQLDAVPTDAALALFADSSAAVVRGATAVLLRRIDGVPEEALWPALADGRRVRRVGAFRLLRAKGGVPRLKAALVAAGGPDPKLAAQALAALQAWADQPFHWSARVRLRPDGDLSCTPGERTELMGLAAGIGGSLSDRTRERLLSRLEKSA